MPRREDGRLVTGRGRYAGDIKLDGLAHIAFVRSPHAHARITLLDAAAAGSMPGVIKVLTAQDLPPTGRTVKNWLPPEMEHLARPVLAESEVNYVGDAVAAVVAEQAYQAHDAAAAVEVDYEPLPAVIGSGQAVQPNAAKVHEQTQSNIARSAD